ncbi:hypothetical protein CLOM_g21460, partial [Closterium sp. NIES-68]
CISNTLRKLRVYCNALWVDEHALNLSIDHEESLSFATGQMRHSLSTWMISWCTTKLGSSI